jgi:hypothetical protein
LLPPPRPRSKGKVKETLLAPAVEGTKNVLGAQGAPARTASAPLRQAPPRQQCPRTTSRPRGAGAGAASARGLPRLCAPHRLRLSPRAAAARASLPAASVNKAASVKRVVLTSSIAAILSYPEAGKTYNEEGW